MYAFPVVLFIITKCVFRMMMINCGCVLFGRVNSQMYIVTVLMGFVGQRG